ncbi:AGE family epimerase/isomerase [Xanthobacter autotrophicus DSM 431]|uniref:AGE family epimerase/isomerase n=1 Tax=Xanthobacter nonsaccharivorans TaxID=3119912 RepID=UPI0037283676
MDHAFPLWWTAGADPKGGFHEKLDLNGAPVPAPRRLRVQARQIYVYAEAGRLGWDGPWQDAVRHGVDFLLRAYLRPDGLFRTLVAPDGTALDESVDLYDQAFVLFALAQAYDVQGRPAALRDAAVTLLARLRETRGHPAGGFEEAQPRVLPLRSNPHMHMLEATLAWVGFGGPTPFAEVANAIVTLALTCLIDPRTGAIGEYYDGDWRFAPGLEGLVREPGHQFEWAYLLDLSARVLGRDIGDASERLMAFGSAHGIDHASKVAVFALDADGAVTDPTARLWAQTERLRSALVLGGPDGGRWATDLAESAEAVARYLEMKVPGTWRDRLLPDGSFVEEAAPASSFYHIVSAFSVVLRQA